MLFVSAGFTEPLKDLPVVLPDTNIVNSDAIVPSEAHTAAKVVETPQLEVSPEVALSPQLTPQADPQIPSKITQPQTDLPRMRIWLVPQLSLQLDPRRASSSILKETRASWSISMARSKARVSMTQKVLATMSCSSRVEQIFSEPEPEAERCRAAKGIGTFQPSSMDMTSSK